MDAAIRALMREHRQRGLQMGAQLVVHLRGRVVFDLADGEVRPGEPMTGAHVLRWYEAGMPQLAVLVGRLIEKGRLGLDDLVRDHVPGWGNGKERCTIRHLLTHMGGFPGAELGDRETDHPAAMEFIAGYRAEHAPGSRAVFHPTAGWRVLADIVRRRTKAPLHRQLNKVIWKPAGMTGADFGLSGATQKRLGPLAGSVHWAGWEALQTDNDEPERVPFRADVIHNLDWHLAQQDPGIGWFGTARDLAAFYDTLHRADHPFFEQGTTLDLLTSTHRDGLRDRHFGGATVPWGLGFQTARAFGGSVGVRTRGHFGRTGRAMHDPVEGLTFVYLTNGLSRPFDNERRCAEMAELVHDLLCPKPSGAWVTQGLTSVHAV